jgi:hypothetical protein
MESWPASPATGVAVAAPLVLATPNASAATKRLPAAQLSSFQKRDILAELQVG